MSPRARDVIADDVTAAMAYETARKAVLSEIACLRAALEDHAARAASRPIDWACAQQLIVLRAMLADAHKAFGLVTTFAAAGPPRRVSAPPG